MNAGKATKEQKALLISTLTDCGERGPRWGPAYRHDHYLDRAAGRKSRYRWQDWPAEIAAAAWV